MTKPRPADVRSHVTWRLPLIVTAVSLAVGAMAAQQPAGQRIVVPDVTHTYSVLVGARAVGEETVTLRTTVSGWEVRGSNRIGPPIDVLTRAAEIDYDSDWRPRRLFIDGTARGQAVSVTTTFADGFAESQITIDGQSTSKRDAVAADTLVLPNAFLASYVAVTQRLRGQSAGATLRGYVAPQGEIPLRLDGVFAERIETPGRVILATRYALTLSSPAPVGELAVNLWADERGDLLRMSVPAQGLEVARADIASAASRTSAVSLPGDESVRVQASGFSLAATLSAPVGTTLPTPAIVIVDSAAALDRDGVVEGVPVAGELARSLVGAGYRVVRYDRRGRGQSGGRLETATVQDAAEDVRAILGWLAKRNDVDDKRLALVGLREGSWVAMVTAARDNRVRVLALLGTIGITGVEFSLLEQRALLERMKAPASEREEKVELQTRINAAVLKGGAAWDGVPDTIRAAADTPWFSSYLAFDPARVIRDLRQPILLVHGALDTRVPAEHADLLAAVVRARKRADVEVVSVVGADHVLVPVASPGNASPTSQRVSPDLLTALTGWLSRYLR